MAVVAARQLRSPAFGGAARCAVIAAAWRRCVPCWRGFSAWRWLAAARRRDHTPASAQSFTYNRARRAPKPPPAANNGQMLVQADEVNYDYNNSARVGRRQRADVLQRHQRRSRQGHLRPEDQAPARRGQRPHDRCRRQDHLCQHHRSERRLPRRLRQFAARRHRRRRRAWPRPAPTAASGNYTVFENGVYTACAPCKDDPKKPPLWQVKGARIIHDQTEKMMYFENARLEFFGMPMAYMPYFSTPDPTVKRKTGFLMPYCDLVHADTASASRRRSTGRSRRTTTLTFTPRFTTRQGVLMQGEFRQRLINGAYQIRAYGINQLDPERRSTGHARRSRVPRRHRDHGPVRAERQMDLGLGRRRCCPTRRSSRTTAWRSTSDPLQSFLNLPTEAISQLYLTGVGNRSYLRRAHDLLSTASPEADVQSQVPVIHPVIDYTNVINHPVLGGEFSYKINLTSLSRDSAAFDPITTTGQHQRPVPADIRRSAGAGYPRNCLLRGIPGTYTRLPAEAHWRQSFTDPIGQIWTPFAIAARRRDQRLDLEPARRVELPAARRHHGTARDADGRPRIPLSLHQRAALGHHDDRADRAGHRAAERDLCRQAARTKTRRA